MPSGSAEMGSDDDLARLLPEPPPPRPNRRDEAITAAMQRFDGNASASPVTPSRKPRLSTPWWKMPTAQLGALASIVMVAAVSISIALHTPRARMPGVDGRSSSEESAPSIASPTAPSHSPNDGLAIACASKDCAPKPNDAAVDSTEPGVAPGRAGAQPNAKTSVVSPENGTANRTEFVSESSSKSSPAPPAPPPPAEPAAAAPKPSLPVAEPALADSQISRRSNGWSAPSADVDRESGGSDIIVTGARINRNRQVFRRGDWNACTVNDPQRSLRGCNGQVNVRAKGAAGAASVKISEGLSAAWQGDWDEAIRAFDGAIALKPRFAFAYLNRGLAHQRNGDLERAAADLDLAVRYDPNGARNYYNRGMVRRSLGNKRGADKDFASAVGLDADYAGLIE